MYVETRVIKYYAGEWLDPDSDRIRLEELVRVDTLLVQTVTSHESTLAHWHPSRPGLVWKEDGVTIVYRYTCTNIFWVNWFGQSTHQSSLWSPNSLKNYTLCAFYVFSVYIQIRSVYYIGNNNNDNNFQYIFYFTHIFLVFTSVSSYTFHEHEQQRSIHR